MSVTVPPRSTDTHDDRDLAQRVADLEALIEEARRRARRRRVFYAAVVVAAGAAAAAASFGVGGNGDGPLPRSDDSGSPGQVAAQSGAAQWRPLQGPQGGTIFAIAIDPADSKVVYAAGWGRVFKSVDGGASWKNVSPNEPWMEIESLAIDPTHPGTAYVASDRGIGKTVDGGRHWRMVNTGLFDRWPLPPLTANPPNGSAAGSLTVDPKRPATVYATTGLGLYRTRNGGARWQIIGPLPFRNAIARGPVRSSGYTMAFAIDRSDARTIYASWTRYRNGAPTPSHFYVSGDGGDRWRRITMSTPLAFSALAFTRSGALLATDMSRPGAFRSTDHGTTWSPAGLSGETIDALTVDPGSGAIYATTRSGAVLVTSDGGDSWQTAPANLAWLGTVTDPNDPATVYATTDGGLVKSVDHGQTWTAADKGIVSILISALALAPGDSATLYASSGGSVFASADRGRTWQAASTGLDGASIVTLAVEPRRPRAIFAGTWKGLFESGDGGLRWSRVDTGVPGNLVRAIAIDPRHPGTMYVAACHGHYGECPRGPGGVLKSVDGGATWRQITSLPGPVQSLAVDARTGRTVFAGTTRGGIYRSTDAGRSWRLVAKRHGEPRRAPYNGIPYAVIAIAIDPRNPNTVYAASSTGGIVKSTDGGTTWATANTGLTNPDMFTFAVDPHDPRILFASTYDGVFRSSDGGESWQAYNHGLPEGGVAAFAFDPAGRTVYAGTNGDGVDSLRRGG